MAISVTGKLNKAAQRFDNNNGSSFGVRLGVQSYNHKTKQKEWTNYSALLFANQNQADFYQNVLVEGAVIEVSGEGLLVDVYDGQNGQTITLQIQGAKLGYTFTSEQNQAPQQQQQGGNNQGYQQPQQQQAPQQQAQNNANSFDDTDDIPF